MVPISKVFQPEHMSVLSKVPNLKNDGATSSRCSICDEETIDKVSSLIIVLSRIFYYIIDTVQLLCKCSL